MLVADDQKIVRDGLAMLLGLLPGIEVVGVAIDGDDAVRQVAGLDPDVVLMDLHMPGCNGVEATDALTTAGARARVVVLTTYADDDWVFAALRAGARGFLTKDAGAEEIRHALTTVAAGPGAARPVGAAPAAGGAGRRTAASRPRSTSRRPPGRASEAPDGLTPREVEVLALIAEGRSNAEVAASLFVSEATVKTHVNHLLAKTGMRDRAQLVGYAFRRAWPRPDAIGPDLERGPPPRGGGRVARRSTRAPTRPGRLRAVASWRRRGDRRP